MAKTLNSAMVTPRSLLPTQISHLNSKYISYLLSASVHIDVQYELQILTHVWSDIAGYNVSSLIQVSNISFSKGVFSSFLHIDHT